MAAIVVVTLVAAPLQLAVAADRAEDQRESVARQAFTSGRYAEALALYQGLYTDTQHPTYLRNVGRCHQMLKQPEQAIASFREYLRIGRNLTPAMRQEVEGFISQMEELQREREAKKAAAPPPPSPPPPRPAPLDEVLVQKPQKPPAEQPASGSRTWWWIAGGAAVVAAGVAGFFLLRPGAPGPACAPGDCTLPPFRVDTR